MELNGLRKITRNNTHGDNLKESKVIINKKNLKVWDLATSKIKKLISKLALWKNNHPFNLINFLQHPHKFDQISHEAIKK